MKHLFYCYCLALATLSLFSCQKETILNDKSTITTKAVLENKIAFQSTKDMINTYLSLSQLNEEEKEAWIDSTNIENPLLEHIEECTDSSMLQTPIAWQMLFNKELKVQIGDTIAIYKKGQVLAESINGIEVKNNIVLAQISVSSIKTPQTRVGIVGNWASHGTAWIGSRYIPVRLYNDCEHRYVHEFRTVVIASTDLVQQLFFDIKFHYKNHQGWREATGENRHVKVNLRIHVAEISDSPGIIWSQNYSTKGKIEHPICWTSMARVDQFEGKWKITCEGEIIHSVDGFSGTERLDHW